MSINSVNITGNLTRDPEQRTSASGSTVLNFSVAVNERRKNTATGEWEDYPNFVNCSMFGERAAKLAQWLQKGTYVAIRGRLRFSKWTDKSGNSRSGLSVIVDDMDFKNSGQGGQQYQRPAQEHRHAGEAQRQPSPAYPYDDYAEDEIPF